MSIIAKDSGGEFEKTPVGMHQAVCTFVHDIGTHIETFQGKQRKNRKIIVSWEIAERMKEGNNAGNRFMISKYYTLSLAEKATLRKDLAAWRGKDFTQDELKDGFDIEKLIDKNCLLNIGENENGKAKILSINPIVKGSELLAPERKVSEKYFQWIEKEKSKSIEEMGESDEPVNITVDNAPPF